MLPNDVMSKIKCGQVHSEGFRRRHSTLQSHGLFALAKRLLFNCTCFVNFQCVIVAIPVSFRMHLNIRISYADSSRADS